VAVVDLRSESLMAATTRPDTVPVAVDGEILTKGMTLPLVRHHDTGEIRMIAKRTPNRSKVSRSYQFAPAHTDVTESSSGFVPVHLTFET
jgi:hypothetical protein